MINAVKQVYSGKIGFIEIIENASQVHFWNQLDFVYLLGIFQGSCKGSIIFFYSTLLDYPAPISALKNDWVAKLSPLFAMCSNLPLFITLQIPSTSKATLQVIENLK